MIMQDASLVSISPLGNLMFVREEGLASTNMVQMVGMGAYKDKYEAHRPAYSGNMFDPQLLVYNFVLRIKHHVSFLQSLVLAVNATEHFKKYYSAGQSQFEQYEDGHERKRQEATTVFVTAEFLEM